MRCAAHEELAAIRATHRASARESNVSRTLDAQVFRHALRLPALSASRACKHATTKPTPMHDAHVSCLQRADPLPLTHHGCERAGS